MNDAKSTPINWVTIRLEKFNFCLHWCKCELSDQHIANCILPHELLFDNLGTEKLVYIAKFLISKPDS